MNIFFNIKSLLFLLFFVSGFCGLLYQIIWLRIAFASFGVISPILSIVISVFMLGLSLGSWIGGKWISYLKNKTNLSAIIFFSISTTWSQSLFFSGLISVSKEERIYSFPEQLSPFYGLIEVYQRLHILAYPNVGFFLLIIGWGTIATGLIFTQRFACQSTKTLSSKTNLNS